MFIFLLPVKHPDSCNNWQRVCQLLEATLRSILGQSSGRFKIIVICTQKPVIGIESEKIIYEIANLPRPSTESGERDKALKLVLGFSQAKKHNPDYVMALDPDDFISSNIVDYALAEKHPLGYFLDSGYISEGEPSLIHIDKGFYHYCGTSLIVRPDAFAGLVRGDRYRHYQIQLNEGRLSPIPFPAAIYNRLNGENFVAKSKLSRPLGNKNLRFVTTSISEQMRREFTFGETV
jgi:hypothetical protein